MTRRIEHKGTRYTYVGSILQQQDGTTTYEVAQFEEEPSFNSDPYAEISEELFDILAELAEADLKASSLRETGRLATS